MHRSKTRNPLILPAEQDALEWLETDETDLLVQARAYAREAGHELDDRNPLVDLVGRLVQRAASAAWLQGWQAHTASGADLNPYRKVEDP